MKGSRTNYQMMLTIQKYHFHHAIKHKIRSQQFNVDCKVHSQGHEIVTKWDIKLTINIQLAP